MNKNKLIEVLSVQSESYNQWRMFAYIIRQLKAIGCNYYTNDGNIYVTKGNDVNYPCVVSHMDTVHDIAENLTPIEIAGNITGFNSYTMSQTGIGGDDKVGIFITLQCLSKFDNIKAVFFRDEEVGCNGSYNADINFFSDCKFVLQCDRRGNKDFVTSASGVNLSSKLFQSDIKNILKRYGYNFSNGMMTDVMALKEIGIVCSMANISCGYYNPHCIDEYVNIKDVANCLELVMDIIDSLAGYDYPCKYKVVKKQKSSYTNTKINWDALDKKYLGMEDDYWTDGEQKVKHLENCECCDEKAVLQYVSDYNIEMCDKCINQYVNV